MKKYVSYILVATMISVPVFQKCPVVKVTSEKKDDTLIKAVPDNTKISLDTIVEEVEQIPAGRDAITGRFYEFSTLHPVFEHFSISLIVVAALLQFLNIFLFKKDIAWIVFLLLITGMVTAIIASKYFHPETTGLNLRATEFLDLHDQWSQWTLRATFAALILQIIYLFVTRVNPASLKLPGYRIRLTFRITRLFISVIAFLMMISAYSVVKAGHYGTHLVHVEGFGPRGKFLVDD